MKVSLRLSTTKALMGTTGEFRNGRRDGRGAAGDGAETEATSLVVRKFVYALVVNWAVLECGVNIMMVIAAAAVSAVGDRREQGSKNWC